MKWERSVLLRGLGLVGLSERRELGTRTGGNGRKREGLRGVCLRSREYSILISKEQEREITQSKPPPSSYLSLIE